MTIATAPVDAPCEVIHADPARAAVIRQRLPAAPLAAALAETFKALGDPTRLRLLVALSQAELCVCDLAAMAGISESAASHQLRLLRALRIVGTRRQGRMVLYRLDDDHIARLLSQGLEHVAEAVARRER
jgi:ArsR family transcriptional regulator